MICTAPGLPNFSNPPVAEVALAAQFEPLEGLRAVDLGRVWDAFRDEYPDVEEHPARPPMAVEAGGLEVSVDLLSGFEKPNLWFVKDGGDRLVQFQHDRLVVNWRRRPGEQYPRYENAVRPMFEDAWRRLASVLGALDLGPLRPNVCEAIYINLVDSGGAWTGHSETDRVLAPWSGRHSDGFLPPAAEVRLGARYALPDRRGWLVVDANPVRRASDGRPALMLQLAGRGRAWSPDLAGVLEFFDLAPRMDRARLRILYGGGNAPRVGTA